MRFGPTAAALAILSLGSARVASAQATVSFDVPLSLTQVHVDIERIRVVCAVMSPEAMVPPPTTGGAWTNNTSSSWSPTSENLPPYAARQELWVSGGQVVVTARVIVMIPAEWLVNPVGKKAQYGCFVLGFSRSLQKWNTFSEQSTELPFKLKVTPEMLSGEFVW